MLAWLPARAGVWRELPLGPDCCRVTEVRQGYNGGTSQEKGEAPLHLSLRRRRPPGRGGMDPWGFLVPLPFLVREQTRGCGSV